MSRIPNIPEHSPGSTYAEPMEPTDPMADPPAEPRSWDDLTGALRLLRAHAGSPSFAELVRRVEAVRAARGLPPGERRPGRVTVYDAFRDGRARLDVELLADLVRALGAADRVDDWRRAHAAVSARPGARVEPIATPGSAVVVDMPESGAALIGRDEMLARVAALLDGPPRVIVVTGLAGAGKSALAVQAAHRYARATGASVRQLGPAGWEVAAEVGAALSDVRTTGTPVLLAHDPPDTGAIRSLASAADGWHLLVTARRVPELPEAAMVRLDPLSLSTARDLLAAAAGPDGAARLAEDPDRTDALIAACGTLPLSLSITGGQIAAQPGWSVADHLHRITQSGHPMPALDAAYRGLAPDESLVLRRLALHPAPLDLRTLATLAGVDEDSALHAVIGLEDEHLVHRRDDGHYAVHEVVRRVVNEAADQDEPFSARRAAVRRLADRLLAEAGPAVAAVAPHHRAPGGAVLPHQAALRLLDERQEVLVGTAEIGADLDLPDQVGALSALIAPYLDLRAPAGQAARVHSAAMRVGSPESRAQAGRDLGRALERLGRFDEALAALVRARESGHDPRPAQTLNRIGNVYKRLGRADDAAASYRDAVLVARTAGDPVSEGRAEGNLADTLRVLGDPVGARAGYDRALRISEAAGDTLNLAIVTGNLALFLEQSGQAEAAQSMVDRALTAATTLGDQGLVLRARMQHGRLLAARGEESGITLLRECRDEARRRGEAEAEADAGVSLGDSLLEAAADDPGMVDQAEQAFTAALEQSITIHAGLITAQATTGLGRVALARHRIDAARDHFGRARSLAEHDPGETVRALIGLGACAAAEGDQQEAAAIRREALVLATTAGLREQAQLRDMLAG